jgi:hypothetical protein
MRLLGVLLGSAAAAFGQIDPDKRELIQLGYEQPFRGHAPLSGYAFYYLNVPQFSRTNLTLRLAIAPVYADSEVGFSGALGRHTDLAVGLAGGGFADSHSEVRQGKYLPAESFTGHGAEVSTSLYHLFNPAQRIPLNGVLRMAAHYSAYDDDSDTAEAFSLPPEHVSLRLRTGLRLGGRAPLLRPDVALELSVWYEAFVRTEPGDYGFGGDRELEEVSHLFWARALLVYTLPEWKHNFHVSLTAGTSVEADRLSVYRLGGLLQLVSEFPLALPGYFFQEISAKQFLLLNGAYSLPLDEKGRWGLAFGGALAAVDYLEGLEQPGDWHSGVTAGVLYRSPSDAWQLAVTYAYGINALRDGDRGAHSLGFVLQFDLDRARMPLFEPGENPIRSRGLQRILRGIL